MRVVLFCLTLLLIPAGVTANALTETQLRNELIDRAFKYSGKENGRALQGIIAYRQDSRIFIRTGEQYRDGGTWRIAGNAFCTRVTLLRNDGEVCFKVTRNGPDHRTSHGFRLRALLDRGFLNV